MRNFICKTLLLVVCLFLASCASVRQPSAVSANQTILSWDERAKTLNQIQSWVIKGSASVQHQGKTDMGGLTWRQQNSRYEIYLSGPLSIGGISIAGSPGSVTMTQSSHAPASANTPEKLMQKQLGWQLPISPMFYWVRGLPSPSSKYQVTMDANNRITELTQQGWNIQYLSYMQVGSVDLPRLMVMTNPQLRVRLVIKNWGLQ